VGSECYLAGDIVSVDPIVTYTRRSPEALYGVAGLFPDQFRHRRALHFLGFSVTAEAGDIAALPEGIARLTSDLGDNRFVMLANSDYEALRLSALGLPTMTASHLTLIDETIYRPLPGPAADLPAFDAVYNARFDPYKRHELAARVERLMLVYDYPADNSGEAERRVRRALPNAWYAQHMLNNGTYRKLEVETVVRLLNQSRVGLCLSASEGAMRASMEYLLCGLMVVSTKSLGGRDRYLMPPYARIVPDDPEAIARAVKEMVAKPVPKQFIRDHIGRIVTFERYNFLTAANRIAGAHFGRDSLFRSITPFLRFANVWRPSSQVIAPLLSG
jgi:glycosyltransferase involved in cell wall biosynthesis